MHFLGKFRFQCIAITLTAMAVQAHEDLISNPVPNLVGAQTSTSMHIDSDSHAQMTPFFHFRTGDTFYFEAFKLTSGPVIFAACAIVFILAMMERMVVAARAIMERRFTSRLATQRIGIESDPEKDALNLVWLQSQVPKFYFGHELARGCTFGFQTFLLYFLMLAVMTFHASILAAVVLGAAAGEMLFGRFSRTTSAH